MTSNTGPILVFPRIQPFGSYDFSSLGKVYSRHATGSVKCENFSVCFRHEVLSDFNCCQECCISTKFNHTIFFVTACPLVLGAFAIDLLCAGSSVEGVGVFINKLAGSNNGSDCPTITGLPVLTWQALYS